MKPGAPPLSRDTFINAYREWGLPEGTIARERITRKDLLQILSVIPSRIPDIPCSLVPASFDPLEENLLAYPRPLERSWDSCVPLFSVFGCTGVMLQAPLFWQVEQPLFRACKKAGAFIYVNDALNMPLGAYALQAANIDAVVVGADDANAFANYLVEQRKTPKLWVIVHDAERAFTDEQLTFAHQDVPVAREVHIFPGVPVLIQCPSLALERSQLFHIADTYHVEANGTETLVTSAAREPLPLWNYALPFSLKDAGACQCGKPLHRPISSA